jgi:hypothetical protein
MIRRPRWNCHTQPDRDEFEAYILDVLDALDEPTEREIEFTRDYLAEFEWTRADIILRPKRQQDPRGRGRQKGESRPTDHKQITIMVLEDAARDVGRVRDIFKRDWNKCYRSQSPTAVEIAAVRYGRDADELRNYIKNRSRFSRRLI